MSTIIVIGKESVGKSQLIASLTGRQPYVSNFPGSTLRVQAYPAGAMTYLDTPGLIRESDALTTRAALEALNQPGPVLVVAKATHLDDDLRDLIPLVRGKHGAVAVTFWDKVAATRRAHDALDRLSRETGLPIVPLDARAVGAGQRDRLAAALAQPPAFPAELPRHRAGWRVEPPPGLLDRPVLGPLLALALLLVPALLAVGFANSLAAGLEPLTRQVIAPLVSALSGAPALLAAVLIGPYGFLTMFPLMFTWAVPTVIAYAVIFAVYKASGLIDRLTGAVDPLVRPIGLTGRDLVRVLMGFGCNVPAVVSTRACSACTRPSTVAAIAFGSACSYQFGATLGVFAAAGAPGLVVPYLLVLTTSTVLYTRLVASPAARTATDRLMLHTRPFLERPRLSAVWREAHNEVGEFFVKALPIFLTITVVASLLDWVGVIPALGSLIGPALGLFNLPAEAALPVLLASVRKDGLLLLAEPGLVAGLAPLQVLTGVYLGGVVLPCLVTALTIAREQSAGFALRLVLRQAAAAVVFSLLLAWGGQAF